MIENCPYKFGFSGIKDGESEMKLTKIKMFDKIQLVSYYLKHFLLNPSYFNSSLFDTAALIGTHLLPKMTSYISTNILVE